MEPLSLDGSLVSTVRRMVELSFHTQYIVLIAISILLYDYFLNLPNEVNWIWRAQKKCTFTVVLYTLTRYLLIISLPAVVLQYFWRNTNTDRLQTCVHLTRFHYYIIFMSQALVAAVLIQRAYALYGKSRWVLVGTGTIALLAGILGILSIVKAPPTKYVPSDLLVTGTCIMPTSLAAVGRYMPSIITAMVLEVAVFTLTLVKSIQHSRSGSRLLDLLLRDGIFYFAAVMFAHFGVILSYYLSEDISRGNIATLSNCLNSTMISRLILHLRNPALLSGLEVGHRATEGIHTTVVLSTRPGSPETRTGSYDDSTMFSDSDSENWSSEKPQSPSRFWYSKGDVDLSISNTSSRV